MMHDRSLYTLTSNQKRILYVSLGAVAGFLRSDVHVESHVFVFAGLAFCESCRKSVRSGIPYRLRKARSRDGRTKQTTQVLVPHYLNFEPEPLNGMLVVYDHTQTHRSVVQV